MDGVPDHSHKKWGLDNLFDVPGVWYGGTIVGTFAFVKQDSVLVYRCNYEEKFWTTATFGSKSRVRNFAEGYAFEYCRQKGLLINETRFIAPKVIEMKVGTMTTIFNSEKLDWIKDEKWRLIGEATGKFFAATTRGKQVVKLHRALRTNGRIDERPRHFDGNGLNNLDSNLWKVHVSKVRYSGIVGVDRRRIGRYEFWVAEWTKDGHSYRQQFRIRDGNEEEAKKKAIEAKRRSSVATTE